MIICIELFGDVIIEIATMLFKNVVIKLFKCL